MRGDRRELCGDFWRFQELTSEVAAAADAEGRLQEVLTKQQQPPGPSTV